MASDRPEGEEERREVEDVIEEVEEGSETDGLGSPELMIKHPLQVGHGQDGNFTGAQGLSDVKSCFFLSLPILMKHASFPIDLGPQKNWDIEAACILSHK